MHSFYRFVGIFLSLTSSFYAAAQCPIGNACTPGNATNAQAALFGGGIYEVKLGATFSNASGGSADGYMDYCSLGATSITLGQPISVAIKTGTLVSENLRIYVDVNNDQVFTPATELFFSSNNAKQHNGNITISTGAIGQQVKMRITSDLITSSVLPGPCTTPEYSQVEDYAVVLTENTNPPVARFKASDTITCNGSIVFTDQSINTPTAWLWNFGDNQTSTSQNPTHQYTASGRYTVKLKVSNASGSDSLIKTNYIVYNDTVPVAASCAPITINQCCGYGITRVVLGTLDNSSGVGSYENFTCTQRGRYYQGRSYPLLIATNPNQNQDTKIWIDYNNNGQFEAAELAFTALNTKNPSGSLLISSDTAVKKNVPLRMRIVSEYSGGIFNSCDPLDKGQCEDYTVVILENNLPPDAGFVVNTTDFCQPNFQFTSTSTNVITEYHWFFGDGTDTTTTTPEIGHTYPTLGSYHVKLIVTGPFGVDSVKVENAVSYFGAPIAACSLNTQQGGPAFTVGIARVEFGSISNRSGNYTEGYQNFTCLHQTSLKIGQSATITVHNSSTQPEKCKVWIDWNNDGTFTTGELIMDSQTDTLHSALVTVPGNAVVQQPLRVRVASNLQQVGTINTCGNIQLGQCEDYALIVVANNVKPKTVFGASSTTSCTGTVQFLDSTENVPTTYAWDFGDNQTSTEKNPVHSYASTGVYTIRLITSNEYGIDTLTKVNYINITKVSGMALALCTPAAATNTCCQYGIGQVTFAGIDQLSGAATEGTMDFTCATAGSAAIGTLVPITITNSGPNFEAVGVWIDWNNDGNFADAEKVFASSGATSHAGNITIPGNASAGIGLRMRVKSDFNNQPLTGPCVSPQFGQVEDYQILLHGNSLPPQAMFQSNTQISCFNTIQFSDTSFNAPSSWKWYFGDGDSAMVRNPSHTYSGPGTYSVTLIVGNANGADTLEKIGYIVIQESNNLKPAPCEPQTVNTSGNPGAGIAKVVFNTINKSSLLAPEEDYADNSCSDRTTLLMGQAYQITVTTNVQFNENCRAWIDWNNDGQFTDPGERILNGQNARTHTASVTIPAAAKLDTALRMRVISDFAQGGPGGQGPLPCNPPNFGQCEDYSVVVQQNTSPPVAKISSVSNTSCNGYIQFRDSSTFVPSSWVWTFGDNSSSTLQNPVHIYTNPGTYTVKLKVTNSFGVDSVEMLNYVTISATNGPRPAGCINTVGTLGQTGISRVRFGTIDKTTGFTTADGGYLDYTCSEDTATVIVITATQTNPLIVNTSNGQNCRVFIDFNNDGIFANSESVMNTQNLAVHTANLVFTQAQCLGVKVRMRVISEIRFNQINSSCYNPTQGQVEDYTVRLIYAVGNQPLLSAQDIVVFPNPSLGNFTIKLPQNVYGSSWDIVDLQGKLISSGKIEGGLHQVEIKEEPIAAGLYTFVVHTPQGPVRKRIVVQK